MIELTRAAGVSAFTTTPAGAATAPPAETGGAFADMLGRVARDGAAALKASESASLSALIGKAPAQEVVQSVMQAERSLHMAIAVRDKLVAAWQDISRMSI